MVDPDAGKTWAQLVEEAWQELPLDFQNFANALMVERGQTREELFLECIASFQARLAYAVANPNTPLARDLALHCPTSPYRDA